MAYVRLPPPTVEQMLDDFATWMAQHAQAKITVRIEYLDGTHQTTEIDHRGPMPSRSKRLLAAGFKPRPRLPSDE